MLSLYDRNLLLDSLKKLDLDYDGKLQIEELIYFLENFGETI